jgi:hypothetical protein
MFLRSFNVVQKSKKITSPNLKTYFPGRAGGGEEGGVMN